MLDGFLGRAAQLYLTTIDTAMKSAHAVHTRDPFAGLSSSGGSSFVGQLSIHPSLLASLSLEPRSSSGAGGSFGHAAPPTLATPTVHYLRHSLENAGQGSFRTGMGHRGNIVVRQSEYEQALGRIQAVDARIAEEYHNICTRIEEMCNTIYIVPHMRPKYLELSNRVKASLVEFQTLTDDARVRTSEFVAEIIRIDSR